MKATTGILLALALLASAATARSQTDDAAVRAARQLANEGIDAFEAGEFAAAVERLQRAHAVVDAPTVTLWLARALAKTGRLVEASERYLAITRLQLPEGTSEVFRKAQADARRENAELQPRIPALVITIEGATEAVVTVDGKAVPPALVGARMPVDPGDHQVEAVADGRTVTDTVTLAEREERALQLRFDPPAESSPVAPTPTPVPTEPAPPPSTSTSDPTEDPGSTGPRRALGWAGVGIGGAGLALGTAFGVIALGKQSDLETLCTSDNRCPTSARGDKNDLERSRAIAVGGFTVGGAALVTGVVLLLTSPAKRSARRVQPLVGYRSVGVRTSF